MYFYMFIYDIILIPIGPRPIWITVMGTMSGWSRLHLTMLSLLEDDDIFLFFTLFFTLYFFFISLPAKGVCVCVKNKQVFNELYKIKNKVP